MGASFMAARRVLIIIYQFPPRGGVAVFRALSFARYLPQYGHEVSVVTAGNAATPFHDPSLLRQVPASVRVERTFTPEVPYAWRDWIWKRLQRGQANTRAPSGEMSGAGGGLRSHARGLLRAFASPDPQRLWTTWALRAARRVIRRDSIDAVVVSVPPFSVLRIIPQLRRDFPALPVVADFRDEWLDYTLGTLEGPGAETKRRQAAEIERAAVAASNLVLSVTPGWVQTLRDRYPGEPERKFQCLPNGFDPEALRAFTRRPHGTDRLVLTYMGALYANPSYTPAPFLEALDQLEPELRDRLELRLIGRVERGMEALLANRSFRIHAHGHMPQEKGFQLLEETDALVLFSSDPAPIPAKLFEYLATGKPVLAMTPPHGEAARILREIGGGVVMDPGNAEEMRAAVRAVARKAPFPAVRPEKLESYSRRQLAGGLSAMLNALGSSE